MKQVYNVCDFYEDSTELCNLEQLAGFLRAYKLSQYFQVFVSEGFDRLLSLFDITESDLISLDVKRGHRRLLQRAIATARGIPISTPILINYGYNVEQQRCPIYEDEGYKSPRRNRRRKVFIPSKPVTPFDELINEIKSNQQYQGLEMPELLEIATALWRNLTGLEKEKYEREALHSNADCIPDGIERQYESDDYMM